jgi:hypothetical protein
MNEWRMVTTVAKPRWLAGILAAITLAQGAVPAQGQTAPSAGAPTPPAQITPDSLTDADVVRSIEHGIDFLIANMDEKFKSIQTVPEKNRGDTKIIGDPGELMLEAYALLHVGADLKDPRLAVHTPRMESLADLLVRLDSDATYTTALQTLALAQLPQTAEVKAALVRNATKVINGRGRLGGYTYSLTKDKEHQDGSNSQYALLSVWAAADADWDFKPPASFWRGTNEFWRQYQKSDGGWGYGGLTTEAAIAQQPSTASMTTAGLASLFVCDEFLNTIPRLVPRDDPAIDSGLAAMIASFDPNSQNFYYLYGVERVGLACGLKFFGRDDWYREIAVNVLKRQEANGSYDSVFAGASQVVSTCYAILLLARGRAPVLMNKLQYNGLWNARPRDSANVHAYLAKKLERHTNWQVVPLDVSPRQWMDAPVLMIAGSKDPDFTLDDVAKFKQFVDAGGMIFSVSDGASQEFTNAMQKYAVQMLDTQPGAGQPSAFRELSPDHPLFNIDGRMANPPKLMGVSNGVRELWIHCPEDFGAIWQSKDFSHSEPWDLPQALYAYATGKGELRSKLQTLSVPVPKKKPSRRAIVAELSFQGNWNPEPGAWPRLAQLMAIDGSMQLTVTPVPTASLEKMTEMPALAHLGGTGKLVLTDDEKKNVKAYVMRGGLLFVEAMGGDPDFAASAKDLLKELFPEAQLKVFPANYALVTGSFAADASKITEVKYRRAWELQHGRLTQPRLEYLKIDNRVGVIFSAEDLTSGLLGTNTWGIGGYSSESSIALGRNIVLYAQRNLPHPPATRPVTAADHPAAAADHPAAAAK